MRFISYFKNLYHSIFSWKLQEENDIWSYYENSHTGKRRAECNGYDYNIMPKVGFLRNGDILVKIMPNHKIKMTVVNNTETDVKRFLLEQ